MGDLFELLLIQTNEHLRETDRKKNQSYYFFLILTGAYFSVYGKLSEFGAGILILATFILSVVGIIMNLVILNYQVWQSIYINTAIVIQKVIHNNLQKSVDSNLLGRLFNDASSRFPFCRRGTEFYLYNSFLIITSSLFDLFMYDLITFSGIKFSIKLIALIAAIQAIYVCSFNYLRRHKLKNAEKNFLKKSWILRFIH
ncbi:MAG: hypothetical protein GXO14_04265 [Thermococci archaeon]|nr:hypothetical protein [Thermococci archaeon]